MMASDVCFFIDTRLFPDEILDLPGFLFMDQVCMGHDCRVPGGICGYVKHGREFVISGKRCVIENNFFAMYLACQVGDLNIVSIYLSPKCPPPTKHMLLEEAIGLFSVTSNIIIGGDVNQEADLCSLIDHGFRNVITETTTRWQTRIDHVYINMDQDCVAGMNPCYYSDHKSVFLVLGNADDLNLTANDYVSNIGMSIDDPSMETSDCDVCNQFSENCISSVSELMMHVSNNSNETTGPSTFMKGRARVIDFYNSKTARSIVCFLQSVGFEVFETINNDQIGLSCGYIAAKCACLIHSAMCRGKTDWMHINVKGCMPLTLVQCCNEHLGLSQPNAVLLESAQVLNLAVFGGEHESQEDWFYTFDVNLFRDMVNSGFHDFRLAQYRNKRWAVFAINDVELTVAQRVNLVVTGGFAGTHWITVAIELED